MWTAPIGSRPARSSVNASAHFDPVSLRLTGGIGGTQGCEITITRVGGKAAIRQVLSGQDIGRTLSANRVFSADCGR